MIGAVVGRPTRWAELSPDVARAAMTADGWPAAAAAGVLRAQAELVARPQPVTTTVERMASAR